MKWRQGSVVLLLALLSQLAQPASADFFSLNHNTTYTSTWSYAAPLTLSSTPYFLHVIAETDLSFGSASQICRGADGVPLYTTRLNPNEYYIAANFVTQSGSYALHQNYVTPGDSYGFSGSYDTVEDTDGDGNPGPKYDYEIDWSPDVIHGRSVTITYLYGLVYGPSCISDPWNTGVVIQSHMFGTEVDL